jgi:hypothetical protein
MLATVFSTVLLQIPDLIDLAPLCELFSSLLGITFPLC